MFQIKPIVVFLLFFFSTLFCFSHGAFDNLQQSIPELMNERDYNEVVELDAQKFLNKTSKNSTILILAANRTHRRDPLDGFKYYTGGWNIISRNYLYMLLPADLQANIDEIQREINVIADNLQNVTANSSKDLRNFLDPMIQILFYVAVAMLILAFLGFLFSIIGLECLVYVLMNVGWIAVVGTFILSGMFLLVHNVVADTCVAMDEWLQNPTANSALENIIPRANDQFAQAILTGTKSVSFALVNISNTAITNVYNVQWPPDATPLYFNQSGPLMPLLCNPFNLNLTDRQCQVGEVNFMNATKVWKNYTCQVSTSGICTTPGRLTPMGYNDLTASLNVSYGLYYYSPFLVDLVDSTYLKTTFDDISRNYCPGMRQSTRWIYVGFTVVSAAVMLSLVVDEGKRRKYTSLTIRAYEEGFMKSLSGSIRSTLGLNLDMVINKAHEQNGDMGYGSGVDVQPNGPNQVSSSSNLTLHVKSVKKKGP
ncbi:hypothetical protein TEA_004087 [Camellia sinensis var. sinensis]|uniref:Uncharacterized protein n=1 Tax=Camellia sinensis var. sinensis TaxID=542762 RepID=A0A4S4EJR4_CAMSN|nr:hypothetical protein TEA_004087 [Camellia sinensis var. sinensis]